MRLITSLIDNNAAATKLIRVIGWPTKKLDYTSSDLALDFLRDHADSLEGYSEALNALCWIWMATNPRTKVRFADLHPDGAEVLFNVMKTFTRDR